MSQLIKHLFAIHKDSNGNLLRTKIAEGTTADFAHVYGFVFFNKFIQDEGDEGQSDGFSPLEGTNGVYPAMYASNLQNLEGKLLTLCDATFTNKEQRESFKSIVKDNLWSMMTETTNELEKKFEASVTELK